MTEKDLDEFEKEFGFKLLPTGFKKPLSEITKEEYRERIEYLYNAIINDDQLRRKKMIRLQNNYAITSSSGSFALVTFVKGKDKEGNEIDVQKPISYHTTLESALQSYSNNRMADLVSNVDLDLKQVKQAIEDLKREIKGYE